MNFKSLFDNITGGMTEGRTARLIRLMAELDFDQLERLRIEECCDEKTGKRYGQAACRSGRCEKIGGGGRNRGNRYSYQVWAVWS